MSTRLLYWLIFVTFFMSFVATRFELGVDEAHYVLYGLRPDWSYFDHPPLVGWVQLLFQKLPLSLELRSRLPAILSADLGAWLVFVWLKDKYSPRSAALAAGLLPFCVFFQVLSLFFLPDSLLLFLFPGIVIGVKRVQKNPSLSNWLWLGFLLGLGGLTKYTSILLVVALSIEWIRLRRFSDFRRPPIYLATFLAILLALPVLYWNKNHDWMSFKYQSGHVIGWNSVSWANIFGPQLSQWVGWGFVYFSALIFLSRQAQCFEKTLISVVLSFLFFFGLFGNFLPHWPAPAMVLLVPWFVASVLERHKVPWGLWAAIPLSIIINGEIVFAFLPATLEKQIFRDIHGWKAFVSETDAIAEQHDLNLGVLNWTFGSRFLLYTPRPDNFYVLDQRTDQFDIWNTKLPDGKDFLILHEPGTDKAFKCDREISLGKKSVEWEELQLVEFEILDCRGFHWNQVK